MWNGPGLFFRPKVSASNGTVLQRSCADAMRAGVRAKHPRLAPAVGKHSDHNRTTPYISAYCSLSNDCASPLANLQSHPLDLKPQRTESLADLVSYLMSPWPTLSSRASGGLCHRERAQACCVRLAVARHSDCARRFAAAGFTLSREWTVRGVYSQYSESHRVG